MSESMSSSMSSINHNATGQPTTQQSGDAGYSSIFVLSIPWFSLVIILLCVAAVQARWRRRDADRRREEEGSGDRGEAEVQGAHSKTKSKEEVLHHMQNFTKELDGSYFSEGPTRRSTKQGRHHRSVHVGNDSTGDNGKTTVRERGTSSILTRNQLMSSIVMRRISVSAGVATITGNGKRGSTLLLPKPGLSSRDAKQKESKLSVSLGNQTVREKSAQVLEQGTKMADEPSATHRHAHNECSICLAAYEEGDRVTWSSNTKCTHVFHEECIASWLTSKQRFGKEKGSQVTTCPICRNSFIDEDHSDLEPWVEQAVEAPTDEESQVE